MTATQPQAHLLGAAATCQEAPALGSEQPLAENRRDTGATSAEPASMDVGRVLLIFASVAVPNAVLVVCLSGVGKGLQVFNGVAPYSLYGDIMFGLSALMLALLYVANWPNWHRATRFGTLVLPWALGCFGAMLKGRKYPWGPILTCIFLVVLFVGLLRTGLCHKCRRVHFYRVLYVCTFFCAIMLFSLWGGWIAGGKSWTDALAEEWAEESLPIYSHVYSVRALDYGSDCGPNRTLARLSLEERTAVKSACESARRVLFMVWSAPCIGGICNLVLALFVFLNGSCIQDVKPEFKNPLPGQEASGGIATNIDDKLLERDLKKFVLVLAALLTGMYGAAYAAGTNMRFGSTLMAFFFASLVAVGGWLVLEMGPKVVMQAAVHSRFAGMIQKGVQSEWVKALFVGAVNVALPVFFALEKARRMFVASTGAKSRRIGSKYEDAGAGSGDRDLVTEHTTQLMSHLAGFNWCGIFLKICLLGELFFLFQVGVAKATYVFLSWMNEYLASYSFGLVVGIIMAVGFIMFLLPPVPGVPVYVFCGVVIAAQGARIEAIGFGGGIAIAIAVAWSLKMIACCGQYLIGFFLGKSIKVQQLIGVDKVLTRAIQCILERKGLNLAKVAVLVGGPDWPVSVTCGILRLNVAQMLLGTAPVIVTLAPCTLAGAFLTKVTNGVASLETVLANGFMSSAVAMQMGSMFLAVYFITQVVDSQGAELAKPRPEHKAVEELTKSEQAFNETYDRVTSWSRLHPVRQTLLVLASGLMLLSGFVFVFLDEMCFQNFSVSSKIDDPLDDHGLGGDVWNIIIFPVGYVALALFASACVLHFIVVKDLAWMAKREHARNLAGQ